MRRRAELRNTGANNLLLLARARPPTCGSTPGDRSNVRAGFFDSQLVDLAGRYDRPGDYFDRRARWNIQLSPRRDRTGALAAAGGFGCGTARWTSLAGLSSRKPS